jgi:uroporphyrinogen decarboxylase
MEQRPSGREMEPENVMTPRERWQAVLQRRTPDRVPMDYWATSEATDKLLRHLGVSDHWELYDRLHIDRVLGVGPTGYGPPEGGDVDLFGCRWAWVEHGVGKYRECVEHPLAKFRTLSELKAGYRWPTVDDLDFSAIPAQLRGHEKYPVQGGGSEPFLTYTMLRGMELAFRDLVGNREFVEYCLDKLFDLAYKTSERIYAAVPGKVLFSYVAEDFGSQNDLLFSPRVIREVFIPRMKRMVDLAHSAGVYAMTHSDGAVRKIIPDLIGIGVDILNPIQWRCTGMDRAELKRDFGDKLIFHGGVDNQQTLAFGTVDDVRAEVAENLRILGAGGGYILAPCHNIQAVSPPENIVAMYETGFELGKRG